MRSALPCPFPVASALALAVLLVPAGARATDVMGTYELQGLTFADGASATGEFTFDYTTQLLSSWNVQVSAVRFGTTFVPAVDFASGAAGALVTWPYGSHTAGFGLFRPGFPSASLLLQFGGTGLAGAPATVALSGGGEIVQLVLSSIGTSLNLGSHPGVVRTVLTVPEPSTMVLLMAGATVIGAAIRRRSRR